jgi:hypothetical protein
VCAFACCIALALRSITVEDDELLPGGGASGGRAGAVAADPQWPDASAGLAPGDLEPRITHGELKYANGDEYKARAARSCRRRRAAGTA